MPMAGRASASSAGRLRTPPPSTRSLPGSRPPAHRSRMVRARSPASGTFAIWSSSNDPAGNRLELFHGAEIATEPFKPGRNISGFRTGPLGMGHVVMHFERIAEVMKFYQEVLEFKVSDYWLRPFPAYFFHVNPRHHSIAFVESGINMVHHMMVELYSFDDVGQGYDLALGDPEHIGVTLGRHSGDFVTSFYTWNPSGFLVEYGWGGQLIDDSTWKPFERKFGPSLWGHERALDVAGETGRIAAALHRGRRGRRAPAGAGDRGQLQTHARGVPVVGRHETGPQGRLIVVPNIWGGR